MFMVGCGGATNTKTKTHTFDDHICIYLLNTNMVCMVFKKCLHVLHALGIW